MPSTPIISIVDDDDSVRTAIDSLVRAMGYRTALFTCANNFLKDNMRFETACLITDIQMPGISGWQLQQHLRTQGQDIPVILMTAFATEAGRQRAMAAGAAAFVHKPFDVREMVQHIETALAVFHPETEMALIKCLALPDQVAMTNLGITD